MSEVDPHWVSVIIACSQTGKEHGERCLRLKRGVPERLRCSFNPEENAGGSGVARWTCQDCYKLGNDLEKLGHLVERQLRDNMQRSLDQEYVRIECSWVHDSH